MKLIKSIIVVILQICSISIAFIGGLLSLTIVGKSGIYFFERIVSIELSGDKKFTVFLVYTVGCLAFYFLLIIRTLLTEDNTKK